MVAKQLSGLTLQKEVGIFPVVQIQQQQILAFSQMLAKVKAIHQKGEHYYSKSSHYHKYSYFTYVLHFTLFSTIAYLLYESLDTILLRI